MERQLPCSEILRKAMLGVPGKDLAAESGANEAAVSQFKNRKRQLTLRTVDRLCRALGLVLVPQEVASGERVIPLQRHASEAGRQMCLFSPSMYWEPAGAGEQTGSVTEALQRAVRESGQSYEELGRWAGMNRHHLSSFMLGKRSIRTHNLDKLSNALGMTLIKPSGSRCVKSLETG